MLVATRKGSSRGRKTGTAGRGPSTATGGRSRSARKDTRTASYGKMGGGARHVRPKTASVRSRDRKRKQQAPRKRDKSAPLSAQEQQVWGEPGEGRAIRLRKVLS